MAKPGRPRNRKLRLRIKYHRKKGKTLEEIGRIVERHPSVVSRILNGDI